MQERAAMDHLREAHSKHRVANTEMPRWEHAEVSKAERETTVAGTALCWSLVLQRKLETWAWTYYGLALL